MAKDVALFSIPPAEGSQNAPSNPMSPRTECPPSAKPDSVLSKKLGEAEFMLAHAAETAKDLKPDLAAIITSPETRMRAAPGPTT